MKSLKVKNVLAIILLTSLGGCASVSKETCETTNWHRLGFEAFGKLGQIIDKGFFSSFESFKPENDIEKYSKKCMSHQVSVNQAEYWAGYKNAADFHCVFERGYSTGAAGEKIPYACSNIHSAKYSLEQDVTDFSRGREEGLTAFCTPSNAAALGGAGEVYHNVCLKNETRQDFISAYKTSLRGYCTFNNGYLHAETSKPERRACLDNNIGAYSAGYEEAITIQKVEAEYLSLNEDLASLRSEINVLEQKLRAVDIAEEVRRDIVSSLETLEVEQFNLSRSISLMVEEHEFLDN